MLITMVIDVTRAVATAKTTATPAVNTAKIVATGAMRAAMIGGVMVMVMIIAVAIAAIRAIHTVNMAIVRKIIAALVIAGNAASARLLLRGRVYCDIP
jgi:hypothetical protein